MNPLQTALDENRRLRRTMGDLVALSTLPALWAGLSAPGIARSLAEVLLRTVPLDLVYVRLARASDGDAIEVFRSSHPPGTLDLDGVRGALAPLLEAKRAEPVATVADPAGNASLAAVVTRFGVGDEIGILVSASRRDDFPTERDRTLLGIAANQTAIVVQRRQAEEQLRERQEWLRVTLASIGDAVIATDVEGHVTFLNTAAEKLTGWALGEAHGQPLEKVFPILDATTRQPSASPVETVLADGRVVGLGNHTILVARDGTERSIDDSAAPIRDAAGEMIGVVLIFRDVTEQRQAENRLRQSEARKSAILEVALDCIITMDHAGKVVEFNPAAAKTFGYRSEDVVGLPLAELIIPPALRERHRQGLAHYLATGEGPILGRRVELSALRADGTELPVELTVTHIPASDPPIFTAYLRDISQRILNERHRNVRLAVTQVLAQATTVSEAAEHSLRAVGESLGWDVGFFWTVEPGGEALRCLASWHAPCPTVSRFQAASLDRTFRRGEGLPGQTWERGQPVWMLDVLAATNFPRAASAAEEGLRGAFAVPLLVGHEAVGVIEFFSRRIREPDPDLLETMGTIARLIAQFVDRKQAEESLRRSEERFRGLMEQAPFSIQVFAPDGRTIGVNRAWEELWGVDVEQVKDYNILRDPQLEARGVRSHIQQAFAGKTAHIPAIRYDPNETIPGITRHDDPSRWLSAVIYPLEDSAGRVREVVLVHEDITARTLAEAALRESRERLDLALQASDLGHWDLSLADNKAFRSARHDEIFGYGPGLAEWTYDILLEHVVAEDREAVDRTFRQAVESGEPWDFECRIRRTDGALRWIWARGQLSRRDGERRMVGTVADITERKQIEEELRDARARLEAALEAGAIVSWTWDIPNQRLLPNQALAELFGLSTAEAEDGLLETYVQSIHADDRAHVSAALERSLESGEDYEAEYRIVQPDGSVRWVIARGRAQRDESGRPLRMPGVLVDITDRKHLEQELRLRVEQLADADRRKDEFLATLAHELRNPLAPIRNSLQILKMSRVDTATVQQTRDMMERQVHHLVRLVDDLLDVSRVMRGKVELRKEPVELATVVARAIETAQPLIEVQGHELEVTLAPDSLLLDADPVRLSQVVANLLTNAAKYTEPGGHIALSAWKEDDRAVLRVRDDGIGIAPDMLPHVFELFVQADHSTSRSQGGLGIGLTLVKNLVELHGGAIEAHSAGSPGAGSEFLVRLPLSTGERAEPRGDEEGGWPAQAAPSGRRVLVVDDNEDAAETLGMLLRLQGHEVEVAHDGGSAIQMATRSRPMLILLDIGMPGMDGYEVARRIRRTPGLEKIVLVAVTGWGQQEDRRRTAEAGFDHHLVKPVEPRALERILADLAPVPGR